MTNLTDTQIDRLAQLCTVTLRWSGPFHYALVDDGQGFPCPSIVNGDYCPICQRRNGDGEGPCLHKAAVCNALRAELDDLIPFDADGDRRAATLRRAIARFP